MLIEDVKLRNGSSSYLIWAEGLFEVRVLEEARDGQDVGAGVHEDEVEDAGQIQSRYPGIVLHYLVQQRRHFLNKHRVKGQQKLQDAMNGYQHAGERNPIHIQVLKSLYTP